MRDGEQPSGIKFGDESNIRELGDLLERRVGILKSWIADDDLWEDR
jgi:hypothetical protein